MSDKTVRVVYPVKLKDGTVDYLIAEREPVRTNLIAHIRNNLLNETFHDWSMNNGYDEKLTLDRINNDLGYCPQNCRWVTYRRQENNKTNNRSNDSKKKIMTHERILNLVANGARKT